MPLLKHLPLIGLHEKAVNPRLIAVWDVFQSSYWARPSLYCAGGIALAIGMLLVDQRVSLPARTSDVWWFYSGTEQDAMQLLETIATAILTVAGVTFSITLAALSMASQNFGPRLLRSFMRDTGDQTVFGIFLATFLYCIVVMRSLHGHGGSSVPIIAVFVGTLLAVASVGALVYFINHTTHSLQPEYLINSVAGDLDRTIERLYPELIGEGADKECAEQPDLHAFRARARPVTVDCIGYVKAIDTDQIMRLAERHDVTVLILKSPGAYVVDRGTIALVDPPERCSEGLKRELCSAFSIGQLRTMVQDPEYGLNQLVEVTVHALSPGSNNPYTAALGIDRLSASLAKLARREIPSPLRADSHGRIRVIAFPVTFEHLLHAGLEPIRRYGANSLIALLRLINALGEIAPHVRRAADRAALREELERIVQTAQESFSQESERKRLRDEAGSVRKAIETTSSPGR